MLRLLEDLKASLDPLAPPEELVLRAEQAVRHALPLWRAAAHKAAGALEPGRYLCHRCPERGFVVMLLAWRPGDATPIHEHGVWGVEAVLCGTLTVTDHAPFRPGSAEAPEVLRRKVLGAGSVMTNMPPDEDVHQVANAGRAPALSLHLYGRELRGNRLFVPGQGLVPSTATHAGPVLVEEAAECPAWGHRWSECSTL